MKAVEFEEAYDKKLGAGDNPNTNDLPYCRAVSKDAPGVVFLMSAWEPSPVELERIIAGGKVYIGVMASATLPTQPPICVMGANPFTEFANPFIKISEGDLIPVPSGVWPEKDLPRGVVVNDEIFAKTLDEKIDEIIKGADDTIENTRADMKVQRDDFEVEAKGGDFEVKKTLAPGCSDNAAPETKCEDLPEREFEINALIMEKVREIVTAGKDPFASLDLVEMGASEPEIKEAVKKIAAMNAI
jgi:hypothetical protein